MGRTVVEKIVAAHRVDRPRRDAVAGDYVTLRPRRVLTHDNSSAILAKFRALGGTDLFDPTQAIFALDHDIQNRAPENLAKYATIEAFAAEQGVTFYPAGSGIGHQVMVEQLHALPETLVVASDSHANMYGGIGCLGTPVVRTDAVGIWSTGTFWWRVPSTVQVVLEGALPPCSTGKDVILTLCGLYDQGEVRNAAVEFGGDGVATLGIDERLAIANMTTEWGALCGWFPVDEATLDYVAERRDLLGDAGGERVTPDRLDRWRSSPLTADPEATYAGRIVLDLSQVTPHVAGPDTTHVVSPLTEVAAKRIPVQKAYLLSCMNARREDLARAAGVVAGKQVAAGVEFYIAAASRETEAHARRTGDWQTLLDAGARPLPSGCGPCIGLGVGLLMPGETGISATNRNYRGRMGSRDARCYLASPEVVAASAIAGYIDGPAGARSGKPTRAYRRNPQPAAAPVAVRIRAGFPERIEGRGILLPVDNLDTDGIYGKDHVYGDDRTPARMAAVVFENHDPGLAGRIRPGDILIAGENFGTGSSREQAVTALQAAGVAAIVAVDFCQTYLRNAFNNGFLCIECPALVERLIRGFHEGGSGGESGVPVDGSVTIDFTSSTILHGGGSFAFAALDDVPQELVAAGGLENRLRIDSRTRSRRTGSRRRGGAMSRPTIVSMPGDGIGSVVLAEAIRVLEAVGLEARWVHGDIGWRYWVEEGNALPERTVALLAQHKVGLLGAVTSKPKREATEELSPALAGEGHEYYSPIVALRQRFDLDVCIRPCRSFTGNPLNFVRRNADGSVDEPAIDAVIFRQNTEGLFAGVEWTGPPRSVRAALAEHPRFAPFRDVPDEDLAISTRIVTRSRCRRILTAAFEYARRHGYRSVTVCEKPNVLRETSGMMVEEAEAIHAVGFSDLRFSTTNIDAQMMYLTRTPEEFGVIVAGNLFGDIISDGFAGLVGGLGFAASGNLGADVAVFEPTHGSAPLRAGFDPPIVNPIAAILSGAMLLDHLGQQDRAVRVRDAVGSVVREGLVRTYDMLRLPGTADVLQRGAAETSRMTNAIIAAL